MTGYGENEPISFEFLWDKCILFEVKQNDLLLLADVIKQWFIDKIAPSKLENQFNWIEVGDVAKYYEKGEGIKGEFIESWNSIERFYQKFNESFTPKALNLIKEMRLHGFDTKLRAGQSIYNFILSRSRRHGLRQNQFFITLRFRLDKNEMIITDKNDNKIHIGEIEYSNKLENLLEELTKEEID